MPRLPTVILLSLLTWTATAGALTLTDDERSWLADHQELSLGVDASWPPFEYRDEDGRYHGLSADYVRLIQDRLGVRIKLVEPPNWGRSWKWLEAIVSTLSPASCRRRNARTTWPSLALISTSRW